MEGGKWRRRLTEAALFLPDLGHLSLRLMGDSEVSWLDKGKIIMGAAYTLSPVDVIPDVIPVIGQIDDGIALAWTAHSAFQNVDADILRKHWAGDAQTLEGMMNTLGHPGAEKAGMLGNENLKEHLKSLSKPKASASARL